MQTSVEPQFISIAVLENAIEAQLLGSILTQRGFPHRLQSYYDTAYDGLFQFQKGWGKLYAHPAHKQEILLVIKEVRSNYFNISNTTRR
jgi:hypothetical protein